ncbi:MAG: hypothetical protein JJU05_11335 [Verrucomicrobia bacterium]|nr:hypothetical protein [Verrucomicrobiota bacterium]MCH8527238.1 hypothetical protein [Kiritimatiellia bacterium]
MIKLHFETVMMNMLVVCTICSVIIASILQRRRQNYKGLGRISSMFGLHALGIFLLVLRGGLPEFQSSFVALGCIAGGFLVGLNGIEAFVERPRTAVYPFFIYALFLGLHAVGTFVYPDVNLRSLNLSWFAILFSLLSAHRLLTPDSREMYQFTRYSGIIFILFAGILVVRFYFIFSQQSLHSDYLASEGFEPIFFIIFQAVYISITYFLLVMVNKRLLCDKEQAMSEIRILSGMLPICASCKNIRDDQGYWKQIEDYLHTHSEAQFSHSICPGCAKKLYPDLYEEINRKTQNLK